MDRIPRNSKTPFDPKIPQFPELDGSCFGVEYSPRTVDCQQCHDSTLCSIRFSDTVKAKVKQVEETHPMLDKEHVPVEGGEFGIKLAGVANKYWNEGSPLTRGEAADALQEEYGINDRRSAELWVGRWASHFNVLDIIHE